VQDRTKGILLAIGGAFFFSMIGVSIKWIDGIPALEKFFFRSVFGLLFICIFMVRSKIPFKYVNLPMLILRGLTGVVGGITFYVAISGAPMAEVTTLSNIFPFMVVILSAIFLKEPIRRFHIIAVVISFIGAMFVIRPGFTEINIYYIIAFVSAIFTAFSYTILKHLRITDTSEIVVFYYSIIGVLGCIPIMILGNFIIPTPFQFFQLLVLGLNATLYQWFISSAYKYAPAGELSIYSYTTIVFSALMGILFWQEYLVPATIIGILCIFIGGYVIFRKEKAS
jgi:drug/metabolite transporter (DMT)-like permease